MTRFAWKAVDKSGSVITGEIDAPTETAVAEHLLGLGATPLSARVLTQSDHWLTRPLGQSGFSRKDLGFVTQQLAALLDAGLTLERALATISNVTRKPGIKNELSHLLDGIRGGAALSAAMGDKPQIFPRFYTSLIAAAEASGQLARTLTRLAAYLERAQAVRSQIVSALIYPALLLIMVTATLVAVVGVVLPQFQPLFEGTEVQLPLATRIVLAVGGTIESYGWLILLGILGLGIAFVLALRHPPSRLAYDGFLLRAPILFGLVLKSETATFAHTLGTLLENGLTLPAALAAARDTLKNTKLARAVETIAARVKEGSRLSEPMRQSGVFPSLAIELVTVGEESGALDQMLLKIAGLYERDVETTLDRALALLVPALTLATGALVAFLIGSIMVGIMTINQLAF